MMAAGLQIAVAQDNGMWLGGTLSIVGTSNAQTQSVTTIMPEFGYNLTGPWAVGGRVGYTVDRRVQNDNVRRETLFSIVPFVRYSAGNTLQLFGQGELPLGFTGGRHFDGTTMDGSTMVGLRFRPGLVYHLTERWGATMLMPPAIELINHNGTTTYRIGINDSYTLQRYLLDTHIGLIYFF